MADIVVLRTENERAKESVLEVLDIVREQVDEGRITAVAIAVVRPDGSANCMWSGNNQAVSVAGAVAVLQHRLQQTIYDDTNDDPEGNDVG